MHPYLLYAKENLDKIINDIKHLVEIESPSGSAQGINDVGRMLARNCATRSTSTVCPSSAGNHLRIDFHLKTVAQPETSESRILVLGHSDTVWPLGTLAHMPFRRTEERLCGPGVLDMKGGLILFLWATRLLHDLEAPVRRRISLLVVSDEETGSKDSRALTENEAKDSEFVLVLEPGTGLTGKLKTARKGVGRYNLAVNGIAAHAGVDFSNGASAVLELARQIDRIAALTDVDRGITVNPGVVSGGTASNVVAAEANCQIDLRAWTAEDAAAIDSQLRSLTPIDSCCQLSLVGGLNRPPMERTPAIAALFRNASAVASELGLTLEESSTGGGSDGNFTAALGVPTLDGLGAIGEGAHASHESILIDAVPGRVALLAALLSRL